MIIQHWIYRCWSKALHKSRLRPKLLDTDGCPVQEEQNQYRKKLPPKKMEVDELSMELTLFPEIEKPQLYKKGTFGSAIRFSQPEITWKHWTYKEQEEANDNIRNLVNKLNPSKEVLKVFSKDKQERKKPHTKKNPVIASLYSELIEKCNKKLPKCEILKKDNIDKPNCSNKDIKDSNKKAFATPESSVIALEERPNKAQESKIRSENRLYEIEMLKGITVAPFNIQSEAKPKRNQRHIHSNHKEEKLVKAKSKERLRDPTKVKLINNIAAKKYLSKMYIRVLYKKQKSPKYHPPLFKVKSKMTMNEFHKTQEQAATLIQRAFRLHLKHL